MKKTWKQRWDEPFGIKSMVELVLTVTFIVPVVAGTSLVICMWVVVTLGNILFGEGFPK